MKNETPAQLQERIDNQANYLAELQTVAQRLADHIRHGCFTKDQALGFHERLCWEGEAVKAQVLASEELERLGRLGAAVEAIYKDYCHNSDDVEQCLLKMFDAIKANKKEIPDCCGYDWRKFHTTIGQGLDGYNHRKGCPNGPRTKTT